MRMNLTNVVSIGIITCAISIQSFARIPEMIEDGIRQSDSAFFANVEWYATNLLSENVLEASGRVYPTRLIWGRLPEMPIAIPRQQFFLHMRSGPNIWDESVRSEEGARVPIIAFSSGTGDDIKVIYVIGDGIKPLPSSEDVLAVRVFDSRRDTRGLREELIQAVLNAQGSEVLWGYALRRLFLLEDDPDRRFDLLLDSRVQALASVPRLHYARTLLTGSRCPDYERCELPEDNPAHIRVPYDVVRATLAKLLGIFETTPYADMAEIAVTSFIDNPAHKSEFTAQEWVEIRQRIRTALDNPEHPLHKLPAERQAHCTKVLERVTREPNPFSSEK